MICSKCNSNVREGAVFCSNCGTKLVSEDTSSDLNNPNPINTGGEVSNTPDMTTPNVGMSNAVDTPIQNPINLGGVSNNPDMPIQTTENVGGEVPNIGAPNPVNVGVDVPSSTVLNPQGMSNVTPPNDIYTKPKTNKKMGILIGIIVVLVVVLGFGVYKFISLTSPVGVYRNLIKNGIDEAYDLYYHQGDKINITYALDFDLDLEEDLIDDSVLDLINKTIININYQMDSSNKQMVLKLDSDYAKDSLLDLELYVDGKNEKTYVYAKDYYDKYIEVNKDDYSSYFDEELVLNQVINAKKAKSIVTKELMKIVKSEDCSKEKGAYVFTITEKELLNRIKDVLNNLKDNQKFLACFNDKDAIKNSLNSIISDFDISLDTSEVLKLSVSKEMFSSDFEKLVLASGDTEVIFEDGDDKTNFKLNSNNDTLLTGYISVEDEDNVVKNELFFEATEFGKLKINLDVTKNNSNNIDKVSTSNVVALDKISDSDKEKIMSKIESSKLYDIVSGLIGKLMFSDSTYDYDEDDYYNINLSSTTDTILVNGENVEYSVPDGFNSGTINSDSYKSYKNGDVELYVYPRYLTNTNDIANSLKQQAENLNKYPDLYANVDLSNIGVVVNEDDTYYTISLSYELIGVVSNTKYYIENVGVEVDDNYYLIFEIKSLNSPISDSLIKSLTVD